MFSATGEETRWFSFLFFPLKSLYLRAFLELWPCFFLISGREGKWCFYISCKASGYKKSLMPRGSAAQGFVVYYDIFFSSFPQLSPIQTLSGSVILRINGSGRGHSIFALQGKYNIAILLGQATPGIFPGVSTINTFNIQLAISIPYFSNNPLFSPFSDHSTQTL